MSSIDERIVQINKALIALVTVLGCAIIVFGYWLYQMDEFQLSKMRHHNELFTTHGMGILFIVFGLAIAVLSIKTIFGDRPGLILNSEGILKNPNLSTARLIPWSEIISFGVVEYRSDTRLVVNVKDPGKYIEDSGVGQRLINVEAKRFGSPVTISATFLKLTVDELEGLCNSYLEKYLESRKQFC